MTKQDIAAVVWDMDGLIFDTERLSFEAWKIGANAIGVEIDLPLFQTLIGMNSPTIVRKLTEYFGEAVDVEELRRGAGLAYDDLIAQGPPLKTGAKECIQMVASLRVPQALATSSSYKYASRKLESHGLLELFNETVTGDQVTHGKPHPEPYLTAAQKLGIPPSSCIAFEDSVNGIHSAKTAGMTTALVPDMCPHGPESLARVDHTFDTLLEAKPFLESLFQRG
ncbi:HAD family hydrolase [Pelagicoccus albus]|uniref:HAD family phosphatase n=1 Tax=Pelagicoccus albus TaxID=415222 RepID=A0A7X1BAN6_9BACT|nr:HAD family phosphatase [Pelagicoccus albus]MBC2607455.1 HAD family phosphatase [Pelagicoccus albus]